MYIISMIIVYNIKKKSLKFFKCLYASPILLICNYFNLGLTSSLASAWHCGQYHSSNGTTKRGGLRQSMWYPQSHISHKSISSSRLPKWQTLTNWGIFNKDYSKVNKMKTHFTKCKVVNMCSKLLTTFNTNINFLWYLSINRSHNNKLKI